MRVAVRFGYLGDHFAGSQLQPAGRTVEGEFIDACVRLGLFSDRRDARVAFAGRTDRGVHARGQVAALSTSEGEQTVRYLTHHLPADIWCNGIAVVPDAFHPRKAALARTYRYYFHPRGHDLAVMDQAAAVFHGTHDFSRFARLSPGKDPRRTVISCRVAGTGDLGVITVTAESFLWHMVRCIASALLAAGEGSGTAEGIRARLTGADSRPVPPASPYGLVLWDVDCGVHWDPVEPSERSARRMAGLCDYHGVMRGIIRDLPGRGG